MIRRRAGIALLIAGLLLFGAGAAAHGHATDPASAIADGIAPGGPDAGSLESCWLCRAGTSRTEAVVASETASAVDAPRRCRDGESPIAADASRAGVPPSRGPPLHS